MTKQEEVRVGRAKLMAVKPSLYIRFLPGRRKRRGKKKYPEGASKCTN